MSSPITPGPKRKPGPARKSQRRVGRRRRWPIVLAGVAVVAAILAGVVAARGPFFFMSCDLNGAGRLARASYVYSSDGHLLATLGTAGDQRPVKLANISPLVQKATIAIEDRHFYEHGGIDYTALVRALFRDVSAGGAVEGGSTITQQLARNLYLTHKRTLGRKLEEGCIAVRLEKKWSKQRILQTYLNTAYYGNGAYGVESAARSYFSQSSHRLTLEQAALLAGLPQAPSEFDPFSNKHAARARRAEVLQALVDTGQISPSRAAKARAAPLGLRPGAAGRSEDRSIENLVVDALSSRYGSRVVREGGLKVYTTVESRLQGLARDAITSTLNRTHDPAAAVVSVDPANGAIRALTSVAPGGTQFFNLAAYGHRQAGSAFKPFVLADAIRRGVNPWATTYLSAPFEGPPLNGKPWLVKTYDGTYAGRIPIADATLRSDNTVYARLTLDMGPDNIVDLAHDLGIRSKLEPVPSIGLGTASVSPLELASAYAAFDNGGERVKPFLIKKVVFRDGREDRGKVWGGDKPKRAVSDAVSYQVTKILEGNVEGGTGTQAQIGRPAAGKTGTTDDYADAWFAGYTPQLTTVVWVGHPRARVPMTDVHGIAVAGGTFPAQIWAAFMRAALAKLPPKGWSEPSSTIDWKRYCGRFQYAATYRDARPEPVCPKPSTRAKTTQEQTVTETVPTTTTTAPAPKPGATTAAQVPPHSELLGKHGNVTEDIDNDVGTGEVDIEQQRWPARSETGEPIPKGTRVVVVRTDARYLYVVAQ